MSNRQISTGHPLRHLVICILTKNAIEMLVNGDSRGQSLVHMADTNDSLGVWGLVDQLGQYWSLFFKEYGLPLGQLCMNFVFAIYTNLTTVNALTILLKYVPTGVYMYKLMRTIYVTSRERTKQKQLEIEDIQLQMQIANTKLCVCEAEFIEQEDVVRRSVEQLRALQTRVRELIASDEALRLAAAAPWGDELSEQEPAASERDNQQECDGIISLLKELKTDHDALPESQSNKLDCGEPPPIDRHTAENNIYSPLSDADTKDCQVKIVKVTNVYKIAYLKNYVKQKKIRRATQQAMLNKKIESIRKLLQDWQKSLNQVINTKLSLDTTRLDAASQEAKGDYYKPNLRDSSDSDSDLRTNGTESYHDEYSLSWAQNPYRNYPYNTEDVPESAAAKELCDSQEYDNKYQSLATVCECNGQPSPHLLFVLPEETSSQMVIEEIKSMPNGEFEPDCRDIVAL